MTDLIAGFQAGDEDAVRAVYKQFGGAVQTIARSMVNDPELTKEVVQQTFLKAWRSASTFDADREFAPWLYSIARRTAIDTQRREARPTQGGHEQETDVAVESMTMERTWEVFEVRRAIDDLPEAERVVVRLSHLVGLSHPEIAAKLDVPVGTIKSRSARGHKRLHAALKHLSQSANQNGSHDVEGGEE